MENDAWKSMFEVVAKEQGHFLIVRKGGCWSYNMVRYRHRGHAERGAKAAYIKINKEFEKSFGL